MSQSPFYVLFEGETNPNFTHDTSRAEFHYQNLAAFCEDAAQRAFPNRGRSRYKSVNACLIRWETDELGVQKELNSLHNVLQDYGFSTKIFLVPEQNPDWDLMRKTLDFIQDCDHEKNLFILYYAGHGRMNSSRQAEWVFGQDSNSPFVDWSAIQGLFATAKSDVLILLDTCAAASSAMTSQYAIMETIAACSFERRAPPPGEHSMTNTLVDVLRDWINKPSFSVASLHTEVLFRLKLKGKRKDRNGILLEWCVTLIHWINTKDPKASAIEICRRNILPPAWMTPIEDDRSTFVDAMDVDSDHTRASLSSSTTLSSLSSACTYKIPRVVISLQLEEDQSLDPGQCSKWLESFPLLAKWVNVEAVFGSFSTLMLMSVPMPIWDMLPNHPACSFIGYVTTSNLKGFVSSADTVAEGKRVSGMSQPIIEKSRPSYVFQDPPSVRAGYTAYQSSATEIGIAPPLNKFPGKSYALIAPSHHGGQQPEQAYASPSWPRDQSIPQNEVQASPRPLIYRTATDNDGYPTPASEQDAYSHSGLDSGYGYYNSSRLGSVNILSHRGPNALQPDNSIMDPNNPDPPRFNSLSYASNKSRDGDVPMPLPSPLKKTQQLTISDEAKVEIYYQTRFKDMQQNACKIMAKAFIKLVEPKKQTNYPYTKGNDKAPPWWPSTAGDTKVRHREPDHLLKPERIRLLVHILRMVVQPAHQQHPTVQKQGLNIGKLEEVTMEAMSYWFSDTESRENASKKPFLREIFRIARAEERYRNGEIDGTAELSVMCAERVAKDSSPEDESDAGIEIVSPPM